MRTFIGIVASGGLIILAFIAWVVVVSGFEVASPPTALMNAASDGDLAAVNGLLAQGVDIDEPRGHYTKYFVINLVDTTSDQRYGETALLLAIERRHLSVVRALLDAGADASVRDSYGRGIWDYAANSLDGEGVDIFFLLGERFEMPPDFVDSILYSAGGTGNKRLLDFALSRPSSSIARVSALCAAAGRANVEMVERLLLTFDTVPPASLGCAIGAQPEFRMGMVKLMVNAGVNLEADEAISPLSSALLTMPPGAASAEIPPRVRELLKYLLEQGADPRWVPPHGSSALALARTHGHNAAVQLFENWGEHGGPAAPRRVPREPGTPNYMAARQEACDLLICIKTMSKGPCFGGCAVPIGTTQPMTVEDKPVDAGVWVQGSGPGGEFGDDLRYQALIREYTEDGLAECSFEFDASAFGTRTQACDQRLGQVQVSIAPNRVVDVAE
jgi:FOG: Ankyrin repeat